MSKLVIPMENVGEVSDGFHSFNELYDQRNLLFTLLMAYRSDSWKSLLHSDGTSYDGWFIAGIGYDAGEQITFHFAMDWWSKCPGVVLDKAPEFDGHSTTDAMHRLEDMLRGMLTGRQG